MQTLAAQLAAVVGILVVASGADVPGGRRVIPASPPAPSQTGNVRRAAPNTALKAPPRGDEGAATTRPRSLGTVPHVNTMLGLRGGADFVAVKHPPPASHGLLKTAGQVYSRQRQPPQTAAQGLFSTSAQHAKGGARAPLSVRGGGTPAAVEDSAGALFEKLRAQAELAALMVSVREGNGNEHSDSLRPQL